MKNNKPSYITLILAVALAMVAGFISVTGMGKFFGGSIVVMCIVGLLELGKLYLAHFLTKNWKQKFGLVWKLFLTFALAGFIGLTSFGVYGYLFDQHLGTSIELQKNDGEISLIVQKKNNIESTITRKQNTLDSKRERIKAISDVRKSQETRKDSLNSRGQYWLARKEQEAIDRAGSDIQKLETEVDSLNAQIERSYAQINNLSEEEMSFQTGDIQREVGPLKFIAERIGIDIAQMAGYLILLIVILFDPLAIILMIVYTRLQVLYEKELEANMPKAEVKAEKAEGLKQDFGIDAEAELTKILSDELDKEIDKKIDEAPTEVEEEEIPDFNSISLDSGLIDIIEEAEEAEEEIIEEAEEKEEEEITLDKEVEVKIAETIKEKAEMYKRLLQLLYEYGKFKKGNKVMEWSEYYQKIRNKKLPYSPEDIKEFVTICNLLRITDMSSENERKFAADYGEAEQRILKYIK